MTSTTTDLCKRFDHAKSQRSTIQSKWEDVERYVTPYRGDYFKENTDETSVEWDRYGYDFDSTAVVAHQNLAAKIHGAVTSPSIRWFDMKFRSEKLNKNQKASKWLNEVSDLVYYALQDSNLDLEINETYQDLCGPGSASITLEEMPGPAGQWNGLLFSSVPLKECYFEEDYLGRVLRFYRELMWTPQKILSKFGRDNVPESIVKLDEAGRTDKQKVIFTIYPRNNRIIPVGTKVSPSKRPWEFCYILYDDKTLLGKKGGYYEMSAFVPRWRKTSGSVWGNSPAMMAMGDIKTLNMLTKLDLARGEKEVEPPLLMEERSIITDVSMRAGDVSVVRSVEGIKELFPQNSSASTFERIDRLQRKIEEYFFVPGLQSLLTDNKQRTAFEVARMQEEVLQMLGPTMGRIQNDLLNPIISRAFKMMAREGVLPEPPQEVIEAAAEFDIEYIGPMARAQRAAEASSIEGYITFGTNIAGAIAESGGAENPLDNIDIDAAMRKVGRSMAIPAEIVRDEAGVKAFRKKRQEEQRAMQEALLAQEQGAAQEALVKGEEAMNGGR